MRINYGSLPYDLFEMVTEHPSLSAALAAVVVFGIIADAIQKKKSSQ